MMMLYRLVSALLLGTFVAAFAPLPMTTRTQTALDMERRDLFPMALAGLIAASSPEVTKAASSTFFFEDQNFYGEPSQQATGDKVDLNSAFVGDYKYFPGMFPHAAGKIASNGPYQSVKEIYKIDGLTPNDIKLFKQYDKYFTVLPPGRMFNERINNRVST
mmetsp:Transcript_15592/g.43030  ORF Transcript_15592/g.43030 Transcript_15592/m.43030 type:complete len:161 (+) Transcript_15592:109-591(+)